MKNKTFLIGEAARLSGVCKDTIRNYIRSGLITVSERTAFGWPLFDESHIAAIKRFRNISNRLGKVGVIAGADPVSAAAPATRKLKGLKK